jgi:hypothetical protein
VKEQNAYTARKEFPMSANDPIKHSTQDNPHCPHWHVDDVPGIYFFAGQFRFVFENWHPSPYGSPEEIIRVCAGRLVMSPAAAERLARGILAHLEKANAPAPQVEGSATPMVKH